MRWKKAALTWAVVCLSASSAWALKTKDEQIVALDAVLAELRVHYGMIRFKAEHFGISYDSLRQKYVRLINDARTLEEDLGYTARVPRDVLPADEFRQLLIGLASEFRDGHLNIWRQSRDAWTLGIYTAAIDGKLYVTGFDPAFFVKGQSHPEPKIGDEIVAIDGVPVQTLAKQAMMYSPGATYRARYSEAMETLTVSVHRWSRPKKTGAPVRLTFHQPGDDGEAKDEKAKPGATPAKPPQKAKTFEGRYNWIAVRDYHDLRYFQQFIDPDRKDPWREPPYYFGTWAHYQSFFQSGLENMSLPTGSIIDLTTLLNAEIADAKLDETKKKKKAEAANLNDSGGKSTKANIAGKSVEDLQPNKRLHVQIVRYEGKQIGILRLPDYSPYHYPFEVQWLQEAIKRLEGSTDVLIIDQLSNAGGYVYEVAEIVGLFGHDRPMETGTLEIKLTESWFYHHWYPHAPNSDWDKLTHDDRPNFATLLLQQETMKELRRRFDNGEEFSGPLGDGGPRNYEMLNSPNAMFVRGDAFYSKPVLILNDNRSASGGDFFPAVMQANGRALVYGETSQGLGGPLWRMQDSMPGSEMGMRCTAGFCVRKDGLPIENIGVVPDIERPTTVEDLRGGFSAYATEALKTAVRMASGDKFPELRAAATKARDEARQKLPTLPAFDALEAVLGEMRELAGRETDLGQLAEGYRQKVEALKGIDLSTLTAAHWKMVQLPIPFALAKTDFILASLSDGESLEDRLLQMEHLPRYANSPLHGLIGVVRTMVQTLRQGRTVPCFLELARQAAP